MTFMGKIDFCNSSPVYFSRLYSSHFRIELVNDIDIQKVYMKPTLVLVERKKGYLRPQMALMATSPITHQSTFQSVLYISKAFTEDL